MACLLGHTKPCKRGGDIVPGDILVPFGEPHLVAVVEPYTGSLGLVGVARSADGWGIALDALCCIEVATLEGGR